MLAPRYPALQAAWRATYDDAPMLGHELRARLPERWMRIHSLSEGKRYAETGAEMAEILARQNRVLSDVLGEGARCYFVTNVYGHESTVVRAALAMFTELEPASTHVAFELAWQWGVLDPLLRAIADDLLETSLVIRHDARRICAPYDGGMDIFVESTALRDELAARHQAWRSRRPDGL